MKFKVLFFLAIALIFTSFGCRNVLLTKKVSDVNYPTPSAATPDSSQPVAPIISTDLTTLLSTEGACTNGFPVQYNYCNIAVGSNVSAIKITPTALDASAVIKVNGTTVASGAQSGNIPIGWGTTDVNIVVTRPDGTGTKTYKIVYSKAHVGALLQSFTVTPNIGFTPSSFSPTIMGQYIVKVSNQTSSVNIALTQDAGATTKVFVNDALVNSLTGIPLNIGDNRVDVVVTAEDGVTANRYSFNFRRVSNNGGVTGVRLMYGNTAEELTLNSGDVYSRTADYNTGVFSIRVTANSASAVVKMNNNVVLSGVFYSFNTLGYPLGSSVAINVQSEDGSVSNNYEVILYKERPLISTNLTSLLSSTGSCPSIFPAQTIFCNIPVNPSISAVIVTPTAEDPSAIIKVNGVAVTSGTPSSSIAVGWGSTTVNVTVERPDGTGTKTYTVYYSKVHAGALLQSFEVTPNVGFTPASFSSNVMGPYTVKVSNQTSSVNIALTQDAGATTKVFVNDALVTNLTGVPLVLGDNKVDVVVTAEDGVASNRYSFNLRRLSANGDVTGIYLTYEDVNHQQLQPLQTNDINTPYVKNIKFSTRYALIKVVTANPNATIEMNGTPIPSGVDYTVTFAIDYPLENMVRVTVKPEDESISNNYFISLRKEKVVYIYNGGLTDGNIGGRSGANSICANNKPAVSDMVCNQVKAFLSFDANDSISSMAANFGLPTDRPLVNSTTSKAWADSLTQLLNGEAGNTLLGTGILQPFNAYPYWWSASNSNGTWMPDTSWSDGTNTYVYKYSCSGFTSNTQGTQYVGNQGGISCSWWSGPNAVSYSAIDCSYSQVALLCACWQ